MKNDLDKKCGESSRFRFTWPGHDEMYCCTVHALQAVNIAMAMGLPLQLIQLTDPDEMINNPCTQIVKGGEE